MELQCGSVTETDHATVYIRWAYCLQKEKVGAFQEKATP
jgi:hypothetical protein